MKVKVSKKEIRESGYKIIGIPYCNIQNLLYCENADYYSCGVYGWSCDYYKIEEYNVIISTGYNYIGEVPERELMKKYDEKARNIKYKTDWKQYKKDHKKLLNKFIEEVLNNGK